MDAEIIIIGRLDKIGSEVLDKKCDNFLLMYV